MTSYSLEQIAHNRRIWVRAMRSGFYSTCKGRLVERSPSGAYSYCPLGLAVAVVTPGLPIKTRIDRDTLFWSFRSPNGMYHTSSLPPETMDALGLRTSWPSVWVDGAQWGIATLNDSESYNLSQIADIVERQSPTWNGY